MNSSAFILGGTKGLGLALAHEAGKRAIKSIISGRSEVSLDDQPKKSLQFVFDLELFPNDIGQRRLLQYIIRSEKPSYFFWNAGIFLPRKPVVSLEDEDLERM